MGDEQRFQALVLPLLDRLLAFARRRVGDRADAEDLVQSAMLRAWKGFASLRDPSSGPAWVFAVLRTTISDHVQQDARRRHTIEFTSIEEGQGEFMQAPEHGPLEELIQTLTGERLRDALAQLPEAYATAVELHDLHGFRYREIAGIVDAPIGSVMSRIHRGRKMLAGLLVRSYGGPDLSSSQPVS